MEVWKPIQDLPGYSVSNEGRVRKDSNGQIMVLSKNGGYCRITISKHVHRLVAEAFIEKPEDVNKCWVDHIDGNRENNSVDNLRWATYSENNSRFETIGVRSETIIVERFAEERKKRGGGHLSWLYVIETLEFKSVSETAKYFNCTISNISLMLEKGTIGQRGITRGYQFSYKNGKRSKINS